MEQLFLFVELRILDDSHRTPEAQTGFIVWSVLTQRSGYIFYQGIMKLHGAEPV
jgi:hypothetical protein